MPQQLPAELERRLAILEDPREQGSDFDGLSWFWLLVFGLALPVACFILGWHA